MEIDDNDREEIARLIEQGYTSGILDGEDSKGNSTRISWSIAMDKFAN